ncbi:MAG: tripartite tricarboxylate transporter TctB family protein [Hyphomicrobiales bacterium]|nr:tripartite tricarboxylate transporter TctB family protein [Alphaproteobacteria bacterium]
MTARPNDERSGRRVVLRRDHIAGGVFIAAGAILFAVSGDLPFGTLASPGAGMMPKLVLGLLMAFGAILALRAGESPPLAELPWNDLTHAVTVVAVSAVAIALYTVIGFVLSVTLLLFVLLYFIERRKLWPALAVSIGVTVVSYLMFSTLLRSPLPPMPFWS